jgi:hypothetical protein
MVKSKGEQALAFKVHGPGKLVDIGERFLKDLFSLYGEPSLLLSQLAEVVLASSDEGGEDCCRRAAGRAVIAIHESGVDVS